VNAPVLAPGRTAISSHRDEPSKTAPKSTLAVNTPLTTARFSAAKVFPTWLPPTAASYRLNRKS